MRGEAMPKDAVEEWYAAVPRSIARITLFSLVLLAVSFGGFGVWAFRAPLAAAVIAQGSFVATGRNKIVQHLEGGIIDAILVAEGDRVRAGQLLVRLDRTVAAAAARELQLRQMRLEATEARLRAEYDRQAEVAFPARLVEARADFEVASILDGQELAFEVSRRALENDLSILHQNIGSLDVRAAGYATQLDSYERQRKVLFDDLKGKRSLMAKGLARRSELTALERAMIDAEGQIGRLRAEVEEIAQVRRRNETQIAQAIDRYRQTALADLQKIQGELDGIREQARAARDVSERAEIPAPAAGTVVRLHYHTAGGVVESGRPILEILPEDEPLIIEVQIPRVDIDSVKVGQPATVRLTALNRRTTPVLDGEVFYVSADSLPEPSAGGAPQEVYVARVRIPPAELGRVAGFTPTPGMPAEIMIRTAERTFADYLSKPIRESMGRAFREQ